LEEAVTNIVNHATPEPGVESDSVALRLLANASTLNLTIKDHCGAFNPLATPLPRPDDPAPEGEGGLGITLLRRHADEVNWERDGLANRLSITLTREWLRGGLLAATGRAWARGAVAARSHGRDGRRID